MPTHEDLEHWLDALAGSHDRLCEIVADLDGAGLRSSSYCSDWTIAQVLSHLGSGADIFEMTLDATVAGAPAPGRDHFPPVWDRWNAMTPEQQAEGFVASDGQLVESLEQLGDRLGELEFTMWGTTQLDAVGFLGMRLSEHAVHTWDVAVALDPGAVVDSDAATLLLERLPQMAGRIGHAEAASRPIHAAIEVPDPPRRFLLHVEGEVTLAPADGADAPGGGNVEPDGGADAPEGAGSGNTLRLPAEALVRLVYGRLDQEHSPKVANPSLLDAVRAVFEGF